MKSLQDALQSVLSQPAPENLLDLEGVLLACDQEELAVQRALALASQFYAYLCELQTKLTARDYSEFASRLDIGAVGAVALENIVASEKESFWQRLLLGGLGETLMIAASRQYIKAWEAETGQVHACAAWHLAEGLWRASQEMQPGILADQRWEAIQSLLAPARDADVPGPAKAMLLSRIFQMLLLTCVAGLLPPPQTES